LKNGDLFSVVDFAKISRTTVAALHHYDKLGLLSPEVRGKNKYRFYSLRQVARVSIIRTFLRLGIPLSMIKGLEGRRTPKLALEILTRQVDIIDQRIADMVHSRDLLISTLKSIQSGIDANPEKIAIQFMPSEPIVLGQPNDYSEGRNAYDALFSFYDSIQDWADLDLIFPVWGVFSEERIKRGDWKWPDRYYLYSPDGHDERPAALYAIGHMCAGYGQGAELYERMVAYIDQNGFEICGDAYEEYPLNELCVVDESNYLVRVMIPVRERPR
jgi:DNA-binding transcriptional MerR regulator